MKGFLLVLAALSAAVASARGPADAVRPAGRGTDKWWSDRHAAKLAEIRERKSFNVVFVGDSITDFWETRHAAHWKRSWGRPEYAALNLGFSGDRTENVLWRLAHGEMDGYSAKVVVLLIGTNNMGHFKPAEEKPEYAVRGVRAVLDAIRAKQPGAKIVLCSIIPRGKDQDFADDVPARNLKVNAAIRRFADGKDVIWADFGKPFYGADGRHVRGDLLPDELHPSDAGYDIFHAALAPIVDRLLGIRNPAAAEVLVDFENSHVERWTVKGRTWRKSGVFLDGKAAKLKPFGLAVAGGKVYVSCVQDGKTGTIEEYAPDGTHLRTLAKLDYNPQLMAVSPDGKWLCVTAHSSVVRRHSIADGRCETLCPEAPLYTRGIKFGPDGNLYLSSAYYGAVAIYDTNARAVRPDQIGTITTYGCHDGFDFGGRGLDRLIVPADKYESIDLFAGTSDVRYPQEPRIRFCISTVRVGGEVFAADYGRAHIVHVPATPAPVTVVAEGLGGGISSMVNLTEALDGSEKKRFAAAKARIAASGKKAFTGVPRLLGGVRDLERMSFNNPNLTVDLSCGIWPSMRICDNCVVVESKSVPRQCVLRFDRIDPYLYKAPVETTWGEAPRWKKRRRDPGYSYPERDCGHFRGNRGFERYFADMDGDGLDDCVDIVNDWTEYGVPGPACPVAYDADEKWTNNHIQAFAYVFFREGKGKDGKWGEPKKIMCDGRPDLQSPYGTGGAVFDDFDGDGDTDMITGDFRSEIWFFENIGTRDAPAFAKGRHPVDPDGKAIEGDLCMMTLKGDDWDGDGFVDLVVTEEDGRASVFRNTGRKKDGVPVFETQRFLRQKAGDLKFGCLATPFAVDWDGDGDQDFIVGNSGGYIAFIENLSGPGVEYPKWAEPKLFTVRDPENCTAKLWLKGNVIQARCGDENSPQGPAEAKWGYTVLSAADWDGDGFLDIMANDVKGSVVLIRNPGRAGTTVMEAPKAIEVEWEGEQPRFAWEWRKPTGKVLRAPWRTTPLMYDWDGDGLVDLVLIDAKGRLSLYERAKDADGRLVLRHPKPLLHDMDGRPITVCGEKGGCGRRKFCIADWDGDGRPDIIINGGNFSAYLNRGVRDGKTVFEGTRQLARKRLSGHSNCPTVVDFNGDGIPDIVSGAEDGYFYYLRNPRNR